MSLTASIIDIIKDYAKKHSFSRVNTIKLSYGALSCIEPKSLELAFEILSKDTLAQGAKLEYDVRPIVISCLACERESIVDDFPAICQCGSSEVILTAGTEELQLLEMDVE
jgi:hydrogenase nickel incorporation protein HypA/HybF